MKLAAAAVTHSSVHTIDHIQSHFLSWKLQTDQRFHLSFLSDGPWECREDRASPADLDFGASATFIEFPERRKAWGAYCRQDWLNSLDPEEFPWCFSLCSDDYVIPMFVETIMREISLAPDLQMIGFNLAHHHYGHRAVPGGTWPALSRCDWASYVVRTDLAKKVGISDPEAYAADGIFLSECFGAIDHDTSKMKILDNFLVVKN